MKSRKLTVIGWLAVHLLHLLWRVLSLFGSRWARKKLDLARADDTRNPVTRTVRRRRAERDAA